MDTVWCVTLPDTEKNFRRKAQAIAWLRERTSDTRIRPIVVRQGAGAYTFYGPGRGERVLKANIDRLSFSRTRAAQLPLPEIGGEEASHAKP